MSADLESLPARLRAQAGWVGEPNAVVERIRDVMIEAADAFDAIRAEMPAQPYEVMLYWGDDYQGSVEVMGVSVSDAARNAWAKWRHIAVEADVYPNKTGEDTIYLNLGAGSFEAAIR